MMIPNVAARNIIMALGPKLLIPLKSIPIQNRIRLAGSKYREAT